MESHGYVRLSRVGRFVIAPIVRVDYDFEIVVCLACSIGDEHDVLALLTHVVGGLRLENGDPKRWVRLLERGYCNAGVLDMVVEAVVGKWFAFPGLLQDLQRLSKAGPLLPGSNVEPLEFVLQIA